MFTFRSLLMVMFLTSTICCNSFQFTENKIVDTIVSLTKDERHNLGNTINKMVYKGYFASCGPNNGNSYEEMTDNCPSATLHTLELLLQLFQETTPADVITHFLEHLSYELEQPYYMSDFWTMVDARGGVVCNARVLDHMAWHLLLHDA